MPRRSRWWVLSAFALLVGATQVLWLTFAPITRQSHVALGVSEGAIGDLAIVNPLVFVVLAIPAGRWLDRRFGAALAAGALLTAAGAVLRTADTSSYATVLAGQLVLSLGQPFVLDASTAVAARWFAPRERTVAISIASAGQFGGILLGALTGEVLVHAGGLGLVLHAQAALAVVAAVAVLVAVRVPATYTVDAPAERSLGWLRRDPLMWRLAGLLFIGVGVFNAVATWLDAILVDLDRPGAAGVLIAVMTVSGVGGAMVLPGLAAGRDRRRTLLLTTTTISAIAFLVIALALAVTPGVLVTGVLLALVGFVLLPGLPVALDWSELEVGPERAATATGFLLLAGNVGGVVLVLVVQLVLGSPYLALATLSAVAVPGLLLAARLPGHARPHGHDDRRRRQPTTMSRRATRSPSSANR